MNLFYYTLFIPFFILIINFIFNKKKIFQSITGDNHQLFVERKGIPLSGGIIIALMTPLVIGFKLEIYHLAFIIIFFIGLLSDTKILQSAKNRFLFQILAIFLFVVYYDLSLSNIRVFFIDYFLDYKIFSYFFVTFCLLIVVNGSNFIDGLNGLALGYYTIVIGILLNLNLYENFFNFNSILLNYLILFLYLILFNYFNKLYLGDSGSYLIGLSVGILLIVTYRNLDNISPFFIVLLLWYPCYENLFSIIRKYKFNLSPLKADNKHFHQLLFNFIKKKSKLSNLFVNNLSSIIINLYNFVILFIGSLNIYDSRLQITLIFLSIFIYIYFYFKLFNFRFNIK